MNEIPTDWFEWRVCVNCNHLYQEYWNIGQFQCKQHELPYNSEEMGYPCCNRSIKKNNENFYGYIPHGCNKSDHTNNNGKQYDFDDKILILRNLTNKMDFTPEAIVPMKDLTKEYLEDKGMYKHVYICIRRNAP